LVKSGYLSKLVFIEQGESIDAVCTIHRK